MGNRKITDMISEPGARHTVQETVRNLNGRWMVAVWQVLEDGSIDMTNRTSWRFPKEVVDICAAQLVDDLNSTTPPLPEPLPNAVLPTVLSLGVNSTNPVDTDAGFTMEDR